MNSDDSGVARIPVKDLRSGDTVLQFFELRSRELRKTRSGDDFLDLTVGDASGHVPAKMWPDAMRKWGRDFYPGDFVKIEGRVETWREQNQLVVDKIRPAQPEEISRMGDLVQSTSEDPDTLFEELKAAAQGFNPPELADLVSEILERNKEALKTFPAARMVHHAFRGGLIEHTAAVTRKVEAVAALEKEINRDIAIAGAMLHDIGKLQELYPKRRARTLEGRLIGHLVLGVQMIRDVALEMDLTDRKWMRDLEHILLSHHGETEFGSPVRPMTREAVLVHFIDNLDSKLKIIEEALESQEPDGFSAYNRWLEGRAFTGSLALPQEEDDAGN